MNFISENKFYFFPIEKCKLYDNTVYLYVNTLKIVFIMFYLSENNITSFLKALIIILQLLRLKTIKLINKHQDKIIFEKRVKTIFGNFSLGNNLGYN